MVRAWPMCNLCVRPADEKAVSQLRELQVKLDDFEKVKLIGRGAYGEVQLVRCFRLWRELMNKCVIVSPDPLEFSILHQKFHKCEPLGGATTCESTKIYARVLYVTSALCFKHNWHLSPHHEQLNWLWVSKKSLGRAAICFPTPTFFQMFVSCAWGSLNLVSAECLVVETSLDRLHVWEKSLVSGRGGRGVLSVFVLGILCKHVFLWVCAYNYRFPSPRLSLSLSFSCYLCHCDLLTISCSYCPCTVVNVYLALLCCRSATRPRRRSTPWSSSTNLRWSSGQTLPSSGRRGTSWPSPTVPGSCRCAHTKVLFYWKVWDNNLCWTQIIKT